MATGVTSVTLDPTSMMVDDRHQDPIGGESREEREGCEGD